MSNGTPTTMPPAAPSGGAIDRTRPQPARRYDYLLGGKDNYAIDRESGDALIAAFPHTRTSAIQNRRFLQRAVTYLSEEVGVTQYLDLGTGIPTSPNTHEIAQKHQPGAHVVYCDNDPVVLAHARALLVSGQEGTTSYLDADIRDTDGVLATAAEHLDFTQPIALLAVAVWHFLPDTDHPGSVLRTYLDALPAGSYLVFSHATTDDQPPAVTDALATIPADLLGVFQPRSKTEITEYLTDLLIVEPGVVPTGHWRPDAGDGEPLPLAQTAAWAAVARVSPTASWLVTEDVPVIGGTE